MIKSLFEDKLIIKNDPTFIFQVPLFLHNYVGNASFGIMLPKMIFYYQLIAVCRFIYFRPLIQSMVHNDMDTFGDNVFSDPFHHVFMNHTLQLLTIQSIVGACLGFIIFELIIKDQSLSRTKHSSHEKSPELKHLLVGFGVVLPISFLQPIYLIDYLSIENMALKMLILALPMTASLRCIEGTIIIL